MTSEPLEREAPETQKEFTEIVVEVSGRVAGFFQPRDGWLALVLLTLNLIVVVFSVERADWVPTPNLVLILLLGMAAAIAFYRIPVWGVFILPVGLALGFAVIAWQLTSYGADDVKLSGTGELWERLALWFDAAKSGSINIDKVPFAFGLMAATWLMGFLGGWLFLRFHNFWGVFLISGFGLMSNLTYLPPNASFYLGIYLFTALMLVARVQSVRRRQQWRERNIRFDSHLGFLSLSDSFLIAFCVVIVAFSIPDGHAFGPTNNAYEALRSPLKTWEDDFNRLFAGLPARRPIGYRIWGDVMAFQGSINPTTAEVLRVESRMPIYWRARSYNTYTPKGWIAEDTVLKPVGWNPPFNTGQRYLSRVEVEYIVTPNYASHNLFAGDAITSTSREARIETFKTPVHRLDLSDPASFQNLPRSLAIVAADLFQVNQQQGIDISDLQLSARLPSNFRLQETVRDQGRVREVTIAEALPAQPDVLAVMNPDGRIKAGQPYRVTSSISLATPGQLRASGSIYPAWLMNMYTQLPDDLPQRVRDLAESLTASAPNPYDKAKAIEAHLATFPYTLDIEPPPFDSDGVDHFLFTLQKGYSEYFASSMTVLLRSVGIPARIATGYTPGDKLPDQDVYIATDSHSHAWVEVYMPRYGWIPFEPTPGASLPIVFEMAAEEGATAISSTIADALFEDDCIVEFEACDDLLDQPLNAGDQGSGSSVWDSLRSILIWILVALGAAGLVFALANLLWRRLMVPVRDPKQAYRRLCLMGGWGAVGPLPYQTPYQYQQRLQAAFPDHHQPVTAIIDAYVESTYANRPLGPEGQGRLVDAWLDLRLQLLWRVFWRRR